MKTSLVGAIAIVMVACAVTLGISHSASALVLGINNVVDPGIASTNPNGDSSVYATSIGNNMADNYVFNSNPSVSGDGRYIAFKSNATNLVSNTTSGDYQIYLRDRVNQTTQLVSRTPSGTGGNADSDGARVSNDGRYVVFQSGSSDLVANDTNNMTDIFRYDRTNGTIIRVSVAANGAQVGGDSGMPDISADGNTVVFHSYAGELVPNVAMHTWGAIFLKNISSGAISMISKEPSSTSAPNHNSHSPRISCDGNTVVFASAANNIVAGDSNTYDPQVSPRMRIYVVDTQQQPITPTYITPHTNGSQARPEISCNGQYIAFSESGSNIVPNDTNSREDIFVYDRSTSTFSRESVTSDEQQASSGVTSEDAPSISNDGRYVVFASQSSDLSPITTGGHKQIYLRDRQLGTTELISRNTHTAADNHSFGQAISANGEYIVYNSSATNIVSGYSNPNSLTFVAKRDAERPAAPTNLQMITPSPTNQVAVMTWDAVPDVDSYNVYRDGVLVTNTTATTFTHTNGPSGHGEYKVRAVKAIDAVDIESLDSNVVSIQIDRTSPTINYTIQAQPNAFGWYTADVPVTFQCADNQTGIASCSGNTTLTTEGANQTVTGTATDNVGNSTSVTTPAINIDKTTPTLQAASWSANPILHLQNATLTIPASDTASGVAYGEYFIGTDPGQGNGTSMPYANGSFTATLSNQPAGVYTIKYRARDAAGHWSSTQTTSLTVTPHAPTNLTASANPTNQRPVLSWNTAPGATSYQIYFNGSFRLSSTSTTFTDTRASEGTGTYHIVALGPNNTASGASNSLQVTYDRTGPTFQAASWSANPVTTTDTTTLTVPASDNLTAVSLGEYFVGTDPGQGSATPLGYAGGTFTATFSGFAPGTHTITYRAKDAVGNWSANQSTILTVRPQAPSSLTAPSPTNTSPVLSWPTVTNAESYNIYRNNTLIGNTATATYTDGTAQEGTVIYHVTAVQSGTESTPSTTAAVVVDRVAPTVIHTSTPAPNANGWHNTNVTVSFTCTDTATGITACTSPITLSSEGSNQTATGSGTDGAGNTQTTSATGINIDKTAPTVGTPSLSGGINLPFIGFVYSSATTNISVAVADNLSGVTATEYYFDTDPGKGNGTPLVVSGATATATGASFQGLRGQHTIYVRSLDAAGNWSNLGSLGFYHL